MSERTRLFVNEAQQHWPNIPGEFVHLSRTVIGCSFKLELAYRAWSKNKVTIEIPKHDYTLN